MRKDRVYRERWNQVQMMLLVLSVDRSWFSAFLQSRSVSNFSEKQDDGYRTLHGEQQSHRALWRIAVVDWDNSWEDIAFSVVYPAGIVRSLEPWSKCTGTDDEQEQYMVNRPLVMSLHVTRERDFGIGWSDFIHCFERVFVLACLDWLAVPFLFVVFLSLRPLQWVHTFDKNS